MRDAEICFANDCLHSASNLECDELIFLRTNEFEKFSPEGTTLAPLYYWVVKSAGKVVKMRVAVVTEDVDVLVVVDDVGLIGQLGPPKR